MEKLFERFLIAAAALLCLCGTATAEPIKIAVFGDSLTSGYQLGPEESYAAKLSRKLQELGYKDIEVINLSMPGETTAQGLERLTSVQVKHPDIVIVELGINDALHGINIGLINNNLGYIIGRLQQMNMDVVLFGTKAPPNMGAAYVAQLEAVYSNLAKKYSLEMVPDIMDGVIGNASRTQADGFHPSAAGMDTIVENTFRSVDASLRSRWNQITQQQYERSLQPPGSVQPGEVVVPSGVAPSVAR